jgi:hypothetical protein
MRVALVGLAAGEKFQKFAAIVNPAKQEYCRRFGYDFIHFDQPLDHTRPMPWSKIPAVLQVLPRYDWVLWHDTDAVMWNPYSVRELVADCGDAFMIVQGDGIYLNSGVFLIRNEPRAHQFLSEAWRSTHLIHAATWEQAAITERFEAPQWRSQIRYFGPEAPRHNLQRCFLVPQDGGWNSLFLHLAGFHHHRAERLSNLVRLARLRNEDRLVHAGELGAFLNRRMQTGRGAVVSVGDAQRASAILHTWEGKRLDVVDPWYSARIIDRRLQHHALASSQAIQRIPDGSLDFVCLAGAHSAGGMLKELRTWLSKLRPEGDIFGACTPPSRDACAGLPRGLETWCAQQHLPLGITTDWPCPTWYVPGYRTRRSTAAG